MNEERMNEERMNDYVAQTRLGACGPGADLSAFGNARSGPRREMMRFKAIRQRRRKILEKSPKNAFKTVRFQKKMKNLEISVKILKKTVKNESWGS